MLADIHDLLVTLARGTINWGKDAPDIPFYERPKLPDHVKKNIEKSSKKKVSVKDLFSKMRQGRT